MHMSPTEYTVLTLLSLNLALLAVIIRELRTRLAAPETRPRIVLPMSSGVNVKSGNQALITARSQKHSFRPERLVIGGTPGDWVVNDIRVQGVSQFAQLGDVPGEMFASSSIDSFVRFDVAPAGRDVQILVTYTGSNEGGAPFVCGFIGTATSGTAGEPKSKAEREYQTQQVPYALSR